MKTSDSLYLAAAAAERLEAAGVSITSCYHAGAGTERKAVLVITRPPSFVRGALHKRVPGRDGCIRVIAAPYHGVQLEWFETAAPTQEASHG